MTSAADRKIWWNLAEALMWICMRSFERVAALWNTSEERALAKVMFGFLEQRPVPESHITAADADPSRNGSAAASAINPGTYSAPPTSDENISVPDQRPTIMRPAEALEDLKRKVQGGRIPMMAIRCGENAARPVPEVELSDLEFRFIPGHRIAPSGFWSRSRNALAWTSPLFLSADVIRNWPAQNTRNAAVLSAILEHLRNVMDPEAPLTKVEARRRCMAEVA
jgi:hypothetical protein